MDHDVEQLHRRCHDRFACDEVLLRLAAADRAQALDDVDDAVERLRQAAQRIARTHLAEQAAIR